jgi:spore germination protein YaaH
LKKTIRFLCTLFLFIYLFSLASPVIAENTTQTEKTFSDVPKTSAAYNAVNELRRLGVTNGVGNNQFGYGRNMTRGEFVTWLVKLQGFKTVNPSKGSFTDNQNRKAAYYTAVETALANGILDKGTGKFRPADVITREEAAVMLVKSMGYGTLADRLYYLNKPFSDVTANIGYATIMKDSGIIPSNASLFNPSGKVLKEQAAVMLFNLYTALKRPIKDLNAFYAISSSSQQDKMTSFTSVCFGWSKLSYNPASGSVIVNMTRNAVGYNEYFLPTGFEQRLTTVQQAGIPAMLMVQATQDSKMTDPSTGLQVGLPEYILTKPEVYRKLIADIVSALDSTTLGSETGSFDGVAVDMEGLKGTVLKQRFTEFLKELKTALDADNKKLYVAVQPLMHPKRSASSMDGYDYAAIGALADKVILMAHDYDAKRLTQAQMAQGYYITPLTPLEDVYYALETITDSKNGIKDRSKIMLQISFDWTVWKRKDGKTVSAVPGSFTLDSFENLLNNKKIKLTYNYSPNYYNPYLQYIDPDTGMENTVWYENTRSVMDKIKLAKLFGVQGISLWRLGSIPDYGTDDSRGLGMDVWKNILAGMEKN